MLDRAYVMAALSATQTQETAQEKRTREREEYFQNLRDGNLKVVGNHSVFNSIDVESEETELEAATRTRLQSR